MAVIARIATGDMGWVFAGCRHAIVAGIAGADYLGVINGKDRRENVGVVAVLANIAGLDVRWRFSNCVRTVMAVNAISRDIQVVEISG